MCCSLLAVRVHVQFRHPMLCPLSADVCPWPLCMYDKTLRSAVAHGLRAGLFATTVPGTSLFRPRHCAGRVTLPVCQLPTTVTQ